MIRLTLKFFFVRLIICSFALIFGITQDKRLSSEYDNNYIG